MNRDVHFFFLYASNFWNVTDELSWSLWSEVRYIQVYTGCFHLDLRVRMYFCKLLYTEKDISFAKIKKTTQHVYQRQCM